MSGYGGSPEAVPAGAFERSEERFDRLRVGLSGAGTAGLTHADLEVWLAGRARELTRALLQDHLDLRAVRERRLAVAPVGADGVVRTRVEKAHGRGLSTVFGLVRVSRLAYRAPGRPTCIRPTPGRTCRMGCTGTGWPGWWRWRRPAARSTTRWRRWSGRPGCGSASGSWLSWPGPAPPTSAPSAPRTGPGPRSRIGCWCCSSMARAS